MAYAEINGGICGFLTRVTVTAEGNTARVEIESDCPSIQNLASHISEVDPFREISHQGERPAVLELSEKHCPHSACPVPAGIIKAIEVETGLALPADAAISVTRERET